MADTYLINDIFYSIQGEGHRVGTANVFLRFAKCNMQCDLAPGQKSPGGFKCDTEFESGTKMTAEEIVKRMFEVRGGRDGDWAVVMTGGEPALQVDHDLLGCLSGWHKAIETNGSIKVPSASRFDWITVSPKVAEHAIVQRTANEVKYVRSSNQGAPESVVQADHHFVVPATVDNSVDLNALANCIRIVKENPKWRLLPQMHVLWNVR